MLLSIQSPTSGARGKNQIPKEPVAERSNDRLFNLSNNVIVVILPYENPLSACFGF